MATRDVMRPLLAALPRACIERACRFETASPSAGAEPGDPSILLHHTPAGVQRLLIPESWIEDASVDIWAEIRPVLERYHHERTHPSTAAPAGDPGAAGC